MSRIQQIYLDLRSAIAEGRYAPGQKLKAEHIAEQLDVSGGTVREALNRLLSDGLVEVADRRGFTVTPFSVADLRDITRARLLIEVECVRDAVANGDDRWEASVVAAYHHLDMLARQRGGADDWHELEIRNRAFHTALVSGCGSPTLVGFYHQLFTRHYRYRRYALQNRGIVAGARKDHTALLRAVTERDVEAATDIIKGHILRTQDSSEALIAAFADEAARKGMKSQVAAG